MPQGHQSILGLDLALLGEVGQQGGRQATGGARRVGLGPIGHPGGGPDDTGEVVVHASGRQRRTGISIIEGEQPGDAQLLECIGPLPEEGAQFHSCVSQRQGGAASRGAQSAAPFNGTIDVLTGTRRVLSQRREPVPVEFR